MCLAVGREEMFGRVFEIVNTRLRLWRPRILVAS